MHDQAQIPVSPLNISSHAKYLELLGQQIRQQTWKELSKYCLSLLIPLARLLQRGYGHKPVHPFGHSAMNRGCLGKLH